MPAWWCVVDDCPSRPGWDQSRNQHQPGKISLSVLQTHRPHGASMCEPGPQLHSVCRALCILEHLKGPQAKVLMFKNMRRGQQADPEIYLGMMANINRTVCILENVGIFSCNVQIADNLWGGDSQASWPEKQQGRAVTHLGCDTHLGCGDVFLPVLTSMPLAPQHISYSDCLRQWEPPTVTSAQGLGPPLLGAFPVPVTAQTSLVHTGWGWPQHRHGTWGPAVLAQRNGWRCSPREGSSGKGGRSTAPRCRSGRWGGSGRGCNLCQSKPHSS